jgi:hypothetical protein
MIITIDNLICSYRATQNGPDTWRMEMSLHEGVWYYFDTYFLQDVLDLARTCLLPTD